jgi:hypothetical protein
MRWRLPSRPRCSLVVLVAAAGHDGRRPATSRRSRQSAVCQSSLPRINSYANLEVESHPYNKSMDGLTGNANELSSAGATKI